MSRAATSRLKVNAQQGIRPSLEFRRLSELKIDPAYQRTIETGASQTLIRRIAMFWDWSLCQPLAVAKRQDGELYVVDGQHRLEAARLRNDIYDLPCVVTSYSGPGDEAAAFVALNQQRRPLSRIDLFKAALAAGDDAATEIVMLMKAAGLSLAPHTNFTAWKPGMVVNLNGIQHSHRAYGPTVTLAALKALAGGFPGQVLRYAGTIFPGISGFLADEAKADRPVDGELFGLVLQGCSQAEWVSEIMLEAAASGKRRQISAKTVIGRAYAEAAMDEAA